MKLIEVDKLPIRCIECDRKAEIYIKATEDERIRMELEDDFNFDCGCCDYGAERFYFIK